MPLVPSNVEQPRVEPQPQTRAPATPESEIYVEGEPLPEAELTRIKEAHPKQEPTPAPTQRPQRKNPADFHGAKDAVDIKIEKILEENLGDAYSELTPIDQAAFQLKGEETAHAVRKLLTEVKINIKMIFETILVWLKMLPGVNFFFIEQEAKIKTDKLLLLREESA